MLYTVIKNNLTVYDATTGTYVAELKSGQKVDVVEIIKEGNRDIALLQDNLRITARYKGEDCIKKVNKKKKEDSK